MAAEVYNLGRVTEYVTTKDCSSIVLEVYFVCNFKNIYFIQNSGIDIIYYYFNNLYSKTIFIDNFSK